MKKQKMNNKQLIKQINKSHVFGRHDIKTENSALKASEIVKKNLFIYELFTIIHKIAYFAFKLNEK